MVIGAGPAGLMAAEQLARAGRKVLICEAKPSPARKFLMAGKSGLNLTKDEPLARFQAQYSPPDWLAPMLAAFGPTEVMQFSRDLGQEVFTGSSGRVFPVAMKGSPLVRAWLLRLAELGVEIRTRWRLSGLGGGVFRFDTPDGPQQMQPAVCVLALGGASWQRLGSDGAWVPWLQAERVQIAPWQPANMGVTLTWSRHMEKHFGQPLKGITLTAADLQSRGEIVISAKGLEGGGIYPLAPALRRGALLQIDLLPGLSAPEVTQRLARMRSSETVVNRLRKLGLSPAAVALVMEWGRADPLAAPKALNVPYSGLRPLDEAISVAGGVMRAALTDELELKAMPGTYLCGEMLDWEAPTGGYLLTGCFASGHWVGLAAARYRGTQ
nr:TIGR03862 family flavoprotein [Pseudogemmobacter hezensis]